MRRIAPYSAIDRVLRVDGRTREGRLVSELRKKLAAHIPAPNIVQAMAIERLVATYLRLLLLDQRLVAQKRRGDDEGNRAALATVRAYNEASMSFVKLLGVLGLDPTLPDAEPAPVPLAQYLAATAETWKPNGGGA